MRAIVLALLCAACEAGLWPAPACFAETEAMLPARWPTLGPCSLGAENANGLLVTTTDFSTGAVTLVDATTRTVTADVALGTADGIPVFADGRAFVVHRFQYDFVDVLDPQRGFASVGQHALMLDGTTSPNPRTLAVHRDGLAFVPLWGAPEVLVMDLSLPPGQSVVGAIDLSAFADGDGTPEASHAVVCGDAMFVAIDRIATSGGFTRCGGEALVAVDLLERTALDLDPEVEGAQGIASQGAWIKQLRLDPGDPERLTLLALTEGIERIDLRDGTVSWAVPPEAFEAAGIVHYQLPLSFDVADGIAYVAAYAAESGAPDCSENPAPCFEQARLFRVGLDGTTPTFPEPFAEGFDASERTLEIVGGQLWYGSRRAGAPGLWVFDLGTDPPRALDGPLSTGLPPFSMTKVELP